MSFLLSDKQRKRKKRYELTKLKDSYRVALKYWRGEPIRSQFYKKFEKRVRQLERILKVKQPAQDEKAMVTSVPLDEAGTSFELTHTASEKALKVKQPEQCEEGTENEDETSLDDEPTGEDAAFYGEDPLLNPNSEKEDEEDKTSCEDEPAGEDAASYGEDPLLNPNAEKEDEEDKTSCEDEPAGRASYGEDPLLNPNAEKEEDFATCQEIAVRPLKHFEDKGEANILDPQPLTSELLQEHAIVGVPIANTIDVAAVVEIEDDVQFLDGNVFEFQVNKDVYEMLLQGFAKSSEIFDQLKRNRRGFYNIIGLKNGRQLVNLAKSADGRLDGGGKRSSIYGKFFCRRRFIRNR